MNNGNRKEMLGFNPCFNGSNTYTNLIPRSTPTTFLVSILVLMDLILIHLFFCFLLILSYLSFNPCFNGSNTYTISQIEDPW